MGDKPSTEDAPGQFETTRRRSSSDVVSENDDTVVKETIPTSEKNVEVLDGRPPLDSRDTDEKSIQTRNSTDDEATLILEDGIPAEIPLETLAGPALVTTYAEDFDWGGADEEDDDKHDKDEKAGRAIVLCLSRSSSYLAWASIILFGLLFIGVDIAVFVVYKGRENFVSYNLQLWFTWLSFMWFIGLVLQLIVELVPWAIKRIVGILRPQSTEVLRMRLSYYMALRLYIKLLLNSAWNWGSWAFIMQMIYLQPVGNPPFKPIPKYVHVFYSIWECVFFLALLLFIEKFILQLIVTSFHKKAYGDRIAENDKALKILDRLKKVRRRNPQDHILKRIRRNKQNKQNNASASPTPPTRSMSADDGIPSAAAATASAYRQQQQQQQSNATPDINAMRSIMRATSPAPDEANTRANVHFPSQNMDTLIAIPPLEERDKAISDDEKIAVNEEQQQNQQQRQQPPASSDFVSNLTKRLRDVKKSKQHNKQQDEVVPDKNKPAATADSPPPLTRNNTWMTWRSGDEKSFLNGARDFGISTTAIPGKLIKGGYNKIRSAGTSSQGTATQGGTSRQAKALAKRIYQNLVGGLGRDTIVEADFVPYFRTPEEVSQAFQLFDRDGNGSISKQELRSACIRIYRERKNLARSMRDLSQATGKLDIIFMVIFAVIWVVIVCAAFGVDVGTQLMPLWSAFIAASFIFGGSAKDAFESIIFVFVTHPFDAGDRVFIGPENLVVQNVGLYVSTFLKWDGSVMYIKNSVLSTLYIINVRRTGPTGETIDLNVDFSTPTWKMLDLRDHMTEWCNQFPHLYRPNSNSMNIITYENQNRITLTFYFEHTQNWQDMGGRWLRHNNYMIELKEHSERLGIQYHLPSQPFQSSVENKEGPAEAYNMGSKSSFGQEGMRLRRGLETGGYREDDDAAVTRGAPFGG